MNKKLYAEYIDSFNRDDFEGFSKYYAEDVVRFQHIRSTRL